MRHYSAAEAGQLARLLGGQAGRTAGDAWQVEHDDFVLTRMLRPTSTGSLHAGVARDTRRGVVLKLFLAGTLDRRSSARIRAAGEFLATSPHPAIVPLLARGRTADGHVYHACPLAEHGNLEESAAGGEPLHAFAALRLAAHGLAAAHSAGVVHRDVTPSNILLWQGGAWLADWDQGWFPGLEPDTDFVAATQGFASPRQQAGEPPDTADDIYSLGATMLWLLEQAQYPLPDRTHRAVTELAVDCMAEPDFRCTAGAAAALLDELVTGIAAANGTVHLAR